MTTTTTTMTMTGARSRAGRGTERPVPRRAERAARAIPLLMSVSYTHL